MNADRSYVITFDFHACTIRNSHEWCKKGIEPQIENLRDVPMDMFSWVIDQLVDLKVVHIPQVAELPSEAGEAKKEFEAEGIQSLLLVPLLSHGRCVGTVGFDFVSKTRFCTESETRLLLMSGAMLSNALERKRAEEALRESEERYQIVSEMTSDYAYAYRVEPNGELVNEWVTGALKRITGFTKEEVHERGGWESLIHSEDISIPLNQLKSLLAGKSKTVEYRILTKKGNVSWMLDYARPVYDREDNQLKYIYGAVQDITERKQAEHALKESHESMLTILDSIDATIYVADMENHEILFMNKYMKDSFGYDLEGKICYQVYRGESEPCSHCTNPKLIDPKGNPTEVVVWEGKNPITERWYINYDRAIRWLDGRVVKLQIATDITDIKQAEDALKESEEKYRTVLETNPDPVVVYDLEGRVIYFNPAFTEVFGWTLEERMGKKMDMFVPDENWPETREMIKKVLSGGRFSGIETRRYTKQGKMVPISISGATYRDRDGNPAGSVINLRDITRQKALENQLFQAQKIESLGTLAGGIAHNFNNVLMGIQGRASLMMIDMDPSHPHFEHLKGVEEYVQNAVELTKDLLGFARGGKYEVRPTDLNELVRHESRMFGQTKKEIRIRGKYEKKLWTVEADQGQMRQVLLNLYVNAWQSMPGGGDIYIQTENVTLDEDYGKPFEITPGRYVKISVTDTGVGMDQTTQQRIFDPFYTTRETGTGTGLGLASVYGIVKNHGGFINVYSERGEGTTFNIYLPASEKEVTKETEFIGELMKGTETVLLVDDEQMVIDVGASMLETLGYKVMVAKGGRAAVAIYQEKIEKIDMVILDMIMPDMNGGETYDRLKEINPDIKVLLSSGYSINGRAQEILKRGCDGFIQKPFRLNELSKKLRDILEKD